MTRALVDVIGVAPLLVVSAALLGRRLVCVVLLGRWARVHGARRARRRRTRPRSAAACSTA